MSTLIPPRELERVLSVLGQLGLKDLDIFVTTARVAVEQRVGITLDAPGNARKQLRADAERLNALTDTPRALAAWLDVAEIHLDDPQHEQVARDVRDKNLGPGRTPRVGTLEIPEKIILHDDTVAFDWLVRAVAAGAAIAWLSVPRFVDGALSPGEANGTGLLLAERHLLTCLHVLEARELGESEPPASDLALQVAATRVAFGYLAGSKPNVTQGVAQLVASNRALDYAVIELAEPVACKIPPLWLGDLPAVTQERTFLVNILQHPGGKPKKLAMRNNAVARVDDERIAYWTDTDYGSSGAPVFDDEWRVIALHRAYEERTGLQYLGRTVAGANLGSRITKIVADLRLNAPDLVQKLTLLGP